MNKQIGGDTESLQSIYLLGIQAVCLIQGQVQGCP